MQKMTNETRELSLAELDAVSGGNIVSDGINLVAKFALTVEQGIVAVGNYIADPRNQYWEIKG